MRKLLNVLYVTLEDAYLCLENENVCVRQNGEDLLKIPLLNLEGIVCFNYSGISPQLMGACAERRIFVSFLTQTGRFLASVYGETKGNVLLRKEQYRISEDEKRAIRLAKNFVFGKLHNQKWVIERTLRDHGLRVDAESLKRASLFISECMRLALECGAMGELRAIEGKGAQTYFNVFDELILQNKESFMFISRNRRPPIDPVNALLSFAYVLLANECKASLEAVGLDSYVGFMHADRPGRPSLALDLMEELRPQFADRFVLSMINRKEIDPSDFERQESGAVLLKDEARKRFLTAWQQRKREEITHPFIEEKINWGLVPHVQALLLSKAVRGDLEEYPCFLWK